MATEMVGKGVMAVMEEMIKTDRCLWWIAAIWTTIGLAIGMALGYVFCH